MCLGGVGEGKARIRDDGPFESLDRAGYIVSFAWQPSTYASRATGDVVDRGSPYRSVNIMALIARFASDDRPANC